MWSVWFIKREDGNPFEFMGDINSYSLALRIAQNLEDEEFVYKAEVVKDGE
jgi:hypothetical protein